DASGARLWDRSFGGSNDDYLYAVTVAADGGFVLAGHSSSPASGNKTSGNFGDLSTDAWIVRVDADGGKLWDQSYGGGDYDYANSIQQTADGGLVFGGASRSAVGGNKTSARIGADDFWVVKLGPEVPRLKNLSASTAMSASGFRFRLLPGETNHLYVIECSADLRSWTPIQTNRPTQAEMVILHSQAVNLSHCYYRARRLP